MDDLTLKVVIDIKKMTNEACALFVFDIDSSGHCYGLDETEILAALEVVTKHEYDFHTSIVPVRQQTDTVSDS